MLHRLFSALGRPTDVVADLLSRFRAVRLRLRLPRYVSVGRNCKIDGTVTFLPRDGGRIVMGDYVQIWRYGELLGPITIGAHTVINRDVYIRPNTTIGRHVGVGGFVKFVTDSHEISIDGMRAGTLVYKPIVVEDYVWIGTGALILGGVTIGRGCVIGAGAVVTRDTEPNAVYVGNPARLLRSLAPLARDAIPD